MRRLGRWQELDAYLTKESMALFEKHGVMSHKESEARVEIRLESYIKHVQIEARLFGPALVVGLSQPVTAINFGTESEREMRRISRAAS